MATRAADWVIPIAVLCCATAAAAEPASQPSRPASVVRPEVLVRAAAVVLDCLAEPLEVDVLLVGFAPGERQVHLLVERNDGPQRLPAVQRGDDRYAARVIPRPGAPGRRALTSP